MQQKLIDTQTASFQTEFDPVEAELAGAFAEDALSAMDALESSIDLNDALGEMRPYFLDDYGYTDIPPFVTVTNALELFGMKPDETAPETLARYNAEHSNKKS